MQACERLQIESLDRQSPDRPQNWPELPTRERELRRIRPAKYTVDLGLCGRIGYFALLAA